MKPNVGNKTGDKLAGNVGDIPPIGPVRPFMMWEPLRSRPVAAILVRPANGDIAAVDDESDVMWPTIITQIEDYN